MLSNNLRGIFHTENWSKNLTQNAEKNQAQWTVEENRKRKYLILRSFDIV